MLRYKENNPHKVIKDSLGLLANISIAEFNAMRRYHAEALASGSDYRRYNDSNSKVGRAGGVDYLINKKREGYTMTEISKELGYSSPAMISIWLKRRGLSWARLR